MRNRVITLCAFFAPTASLILLIWLCSVFQVPVGDLLVGNWNSLGFNWKSVGGPGGPIVSAAGNGDQLYVSTSDKRIFTLDNPESSRPTWEQIRDTPQFDQPARLFLACSLIAVDGNKIYAYSGQWKQLNHTLIGVVRAMTTGPGGILLEGETQILYSQDCGKTWQEIWNAQSLESNVASTWRDLIVASNGTIQAHSFTENRGCYKVDEGGWRDISGILAGKHIHFLATGQSWLVAATENEIYGSKLTSPLPAWESFSTGLPDGYQVKGIGSQGWTISSLGWNIGLITDQGLYVLPPNRKSWSSQQGLGKATFYLNDVSLPAEDIIERTYVITDNTVWTHEQGSSTYELVVVALMLLVILPVLFLCSIVLGFLLVRRTNRWLEEKH